MHTRFFSLHHETKPKTKYAKVNPNGSAPDHKSTAKDASLPASGTVPLPCGWGHQQPERKSWMGLTPGGNFGEE
ncbi:hypothetical protein AVEN_33852-1 [Araneus ventricosus]|uniref:Uncharacterized protein n=1 Tax=Araneus ventricosus TaxID=182803 RepID=A0A4Y2LA00_ARAVE|nr:hypothetical protein AVEN_33852-1 [Araneus ventricosus]